MPNSIKWATRVNVENHIFADSDNSRFRRTQAEKNHKIVVQDQDTTLFIDPKPPPNLDICTACLLAWNIFCLNYSPFEPNKFFLKQKL